MKEFKYYIRTKALNSVVVMPNPGKKFSDEEKSEISKILTSNIQHISCRISKVSVGITVFYEKLTNIKEVCLHTLIEEALPKAKTKAQMAQDAANEARKEKREAVEKEREEIINSDTQAAKWVADHFGDTMNNYNTVAMINFLSGKDSEFTGLPNHRSCDVMVELGAASYCNEYGYQMNYQALKAKFEASFA